MSRVEGYFGPREQVYAEPIYRNLFGQLKEFGDAEIASLFSAQHLLVTRIAVPGAVHPVNIEGAASIAAPGVITYPSKDSEMIEVKRLERINLRNKNASLVMVSESDQIDSLPFPLYYSLNETYIPWTNEGSSIPNQSVPTSWLTAARKRQLDELLMHTQRLLHRSDKVRAKFWSKADRTSLESWEKTSVEYRDYVHRELIGKLPE